MTKTIRRLPRTSGIRMKRSVPSRRWRRSYAQRWCRQSAATPCSRACRLRSTVSAGACSNSYRGSRPFTIGSHLRGCLIILRKTVRTGSTLSCYIHHSCTLVRVHPVSGRNILFVNPQFTIAIKDMDERESRSLLDTLFHQALIPEYQFRLHWAPHTIAIWDNRSTQHYAVNDYYPQRRFMDRVTIRGGPVIGVKTADPHSVRKAKRIVSPDIERYGGHRPHR